jgi:hypothetical protein
MTDTTNATPGGMDLMQLLSAEPALSTFKVDVMFDADGNPLAGFVIVGKNSPQFQAVEKKVRVDNVVRSSNRKSAIDGSTEAGAETLIRTVDLNQRATAVAVVVGWYGFLMNGVETAFDPDTLAKVFDKYPTWQTKVLLALEADTNFLKV